MPLGSLKQQKKYLSGYKIAGTIRCLNLVLGYKGNGRKGYKWIPALLKPKGLIGE